MQQPIPECLWFGFGEVAVEGEHLEPGHQIGGDLIRGGELRRLKVCAAPDCDAVLFDVSRNRSKIFCDTGNCGNRQHVAAYRERRGKEG